jgi:hypothetical protein
MPTMKIGTQSGLPVSLFPPSLPDLPEFPTGRPPGNDDGWGIYASLGESPIATGANKNGFNLANIQTYYIGPLLTFFADLTWPSSYFDNDELPDDMFWVAYRSFGNAAYVTAIRRPLLPSLPPVFYRDVMEYETVTLAKTDPYLLATTYFAGWNPLLPAGSATQQPARPENIYQCDLVHYEFDIGTSENVIVPAELVSRLTSFLNVIDARRDAVWRPSQSVVLDFERWDVASLRVRVLDSFGRYSRWYTRPITSPGTVSPLQDESWMSFRATSSTSGSGDYVTHETTIARTERNNLPGVVTATIPNFRRAKLFHAGEGVATVYAAGYNTETGDYELHYSNDYGESFDFMASTPFNQDEYNREDICGSDSGAIVAVAVERATTIVKMAVSWDGGETWNDPVNLKDAMGNNLGIPGPSPDLKIYQENESGISSFRLTGGNNLNMLLDGLDLY